LWITARKRLSAAVKRIAVERARPIGDPMARWIIAAFAGLACLSSVSGCIDWLTPVVAGSDGDADSDRDVESDTDVGPDGDVEADAETDSGSDADADADTDADTDTDLDTDADADADTDAGDAEVDVDTGDADVDADDASSDADSGESDVDGGSETDRNSEEDADGDGGDSEPTSCVWGWTAITTPGGETYCFQIVRATGNCCEMRETCAALRAPDRPRTGWGPGISEPPDGVLPREGFAAYVVAFVEADTCSFERWRADRGVNETGEYYCPTCLATVDCEVGTPMDSWGDPCRCAFDVPCYYRP
jgi:hypothetical protein